MVEGVSWETQRMGSPGKLTFSLILDGEEPKEGAPVRFTWDGKDVFYGFLFTKERSKNGILKVTAYDQLRYLKNKDTIVYKNKTADQLVKMLCEDFGLVCGTLDSTGYIIESRIEDNSTIFDMIYNALDLTIMSTGKMYVLYDDCGKIALRDVGKLITDIYLDAETAQDFDYSSSIDKQTYNKIKLVRENKDTGKRDVFIAQHGENINKWGVLQHFDTIDGTTSGKAKADALLKLYNGITRTLTVKGMFGDIKARAGAMITAKLDLGDMDLQNRMMIERATHTFKNCQHSMNLELRGGDFGV